MTIEISRANDTPGYHPFPLMVTLTCDVASEFFCRGFEQFQCGFIDAHAQAMKMGWLERQTDKGRIWLCPACSGK